MNTGPRFLSSLARAALVALTLFSTTALAELSPDEAARLAQQRYGGQVLDIQPVTTDRGRAYRIKLLQPSGRVKLMLLDAGDGRARQFDGTNGEEE